MNIWGVVVKTNVVLGGVQASAMKRNKAVGYEYMGGRCQNERSFRGGVQASAMKRNKAVAYEYMGGRCQNERSLGGGVQTSAMKRNKAVGYAYMGDVVKTNVVLGGMYRPALLSVKRRSSSKKMPKSSVTHFMNSP